MDPTVCEQIFEPRPSEIGEAREFVHQALVDELPNTQDIVLMTSELATNVVQHAQTPFVIRVIVEDFAVRVEVGDGDSEVPVIDEKGTDATGGGGLQVVNELATSWGVETHKYGKRVWFQVPLPGRKSGGNNGSCV